MRGRKPLPSKLKIIAGTVKSDDKPRIENEPQPRKSKVLPPEQMLMNKLAMKEWHRITAELDYMGLLYAVDRNQIASYCVQYSIWVRAQQELDEAKSLTHRLKNKAGPQRPFAHPMVPVIKQSAELMMKIAAEFGMTPSARVRVSAGKSKPVNNKNDDTDKFFSD